MGVRDSLGDVFKFAFLLLLFWTFELVNTYYFFLSITVVLCVWILF